MNQRESLVAAWLVAGGNKVLSDQGWPDFLCISSKGKIFAVEVKSLDDRVRPNQLEMHRTLESAGIPVVVKFTDKDGIALDWPMLPMDVITERMNRSYWKSKLETTHSISERAIVKLEIMRSNKRERIILELESA